MTVLKNNKIYLRALEKEDLNFLFAIENNESFWEVSSTLKPYSKDVLNNYLSNAHQDIFEAKQLRLVIVDVLNNKNVGLVDLFDYNPHHRRAGIGILILKEYQNQGFANEVLRIFIKYAFNTLNIHQIFANIPIDNVTSINLFNKMKFTLIGTKKDWIISNGKFKDVNLYQLIKK